MAPLSYTAKFVPHALHPGAIQGKDGIKFCHLAPLGPGHLSALYPRRAGEDRAADIRQETVGEEEEGAEAEEHSG